MRVALDYYRVLMLSARADEHQIEQAYQERLELKPGERSWLLQFSPEAVESRAQLIQEAAAVLLNPEARRNYDEHLTPADPTLTVEESLLPGVLCLHCESGEYQAALDLAQAMLDQGHPARFDAILSRAIGRLELGREAWQQGSYEEAALSLQAGLAELEEYQAFPQMQAEIRVDLGKLRPYRVLQLLSHEPDRAAVQSTLAEASKGSLEDPALLRQQGLSLLKAMLDERRGIEGTGQDGSGLSTEDFLRFIQRVRRQLTLKEQQELFEREAERPSMVATYLAAQVLLAGGYLDNRPALVRRARGYLTRLAQRQDVHLEQAICSLLLGRTEEALQHLQSAQEEEALQFIEEHSAGSPDQLPGLCRFTEKWFEVEVFPEFRDLETAQATLQAYFDNPQVQAYLDEMPSREDPLEGIPGMLSPQSPSPPQPHLPAMVGPRVTEQTQELNRPPSPLQRGGALSPPTTPLNTPRMADLPTYPSADGLEGHPYSDEPEIPPARSRASFRVSGTESYDLEGHRRNRSGPRRNRGRAGGGDPYRPAIPAGVRLAGVVSIGIISLIVIWQMLRGLFTPPPAPPIEQPQVQLDEPPVAINDSAQPEPTPPPEPELTGPLAEWQGVQQVRVISNDGINIRQQPSLTGAIVGAAPRQALLRVVEVQSGEGQVPVWLRIERDGAPGGWIAAQSGTTRLVERP
ncbi:SH3 domain-containing protein [Synechococcus bigranulatus str. 'Rupite']|uniref:SH3 domain-containing protein n=1 Tax=Thermostichus vulcanus str. 'Rupite' TaxID=2813851 RepID=A0ABT0CAS1_THEVL|nr:SH3 domain-containing protein [Thermostichus vulcanus str. 'Rupite']